MIKMTNMEMIFFLMAVGLTMAVMLLGGIALALARRNGKKKEE